MRPSQQVQALYNNSVGVGGCLYSRLGDNSAVRTPHNAMTPVVVMLERWSLVPYAVGVHERVCHSNAFNHACDCIVQVGQEPLKRL